MQYKPPKNRSPRAGNAGENGKSKHPQSYPNLIYSQGKFNREALPTPAVVLRKLSITLSSKVNPAGYWTLRCPFHKGGQEDHPSLNIHAANGHYKCHACGAKGGDTLAFYMAVTGKHFADAARDLGAWRAGA